MLVLISTDIKGVAAIYHGFQTTPGKPEYECARLLMTALEADVNVAEQPGWAVNGMAVQGGFLPIRFWTADASKRT